MCPSQTRIVAIPRIVIIFLMEINLEIISGEFTDTSEILRERSKNMIPGAINPKHLNHGQISSMKLAKTSFLTLAVVIAIIFGLRIIGEYSFAKHQISLISIVNSSWYYHAKKVKTRGFLTFTRDSFYLFLDKESYQQGLYNYIRIKLSDKQKDDFYKLNKQYVEVDGTYSAFFAERHITEIGTIEQVTKLERVINKRPGMSNDFK
jgi:hypothetical protein